VATAEAVVTPPVLFGIEARLSTRLRDRQAVRVHLDLTTAGDEPRTSSPTESHPRWQIISQFRV